MYPTRTTSTTGTMRIPPAPPTPAPPAAPSPGRWTTPPEAPRAGLHTLSAPAVALPEGHGVALAQEGADFRAPAARAESRTGASAAVPVPDGHRAGVSAPQGHEHAGAGEHPSGAAPSDPGRRAVLTAVADHTAPAADPPRGEVPAARGETGTDTAYVPAEAAAGPDAAPAATGGSGGRGGHEHAYGHERAYGHEYEFGHGSEAGVAPALAEAAAGTIRYAGAGTAPTMSGYGVGPEAAHGATGYGPGLGVAPALAEVEAEAEAVTGAHGGTVTHLACARAGEAAPEPVGLGDADPSGPPPTPHTLVTDPAWGPVLAPRPPVSDPVPVPDFAVGTLSADPGQGPVPASRPPVSDPAPGLDLAAGTLSADPGQGPVPASRPPVSDPVPVPDFAAGTLSADPGQGPVPASRPPVTDPVQVPDFAAGAPAAGPERRPAQPTGVPDAGPAGATPAFGTRVAAAADRDPARTPATPDADPARGPVLVTGAPAAAPGGTAPVLGAPAADPVQDPMPGTDAQDADPGQASAARPARGIAPVRSPHAVWPPAPGGSRVPGPGVAHVVAQAVARGMEEDTQDLPRVTLPGPGSAATEVPAGLPFQGEGTAVLRPAPAPRPRAAAAPADPGRRVPRGDDRLRERRGPVLPGSVGLLVGALALAGCAAVLWRAGALPAALVEGFGMTPRAYRGLRAYQWPPLAFLGIVTLFALGGLGRGRTGHAWVLTLFGRYRGTVRRTGLLWVSPLLLRRRVDVRLRHWRSDPLPAVDSGGLALQVVVQVVWQIKDTARAALAVEDHIGYLAEQVESAMARVLSQLPADAFHEDAPTLRDAEAVGDALTRMLAAETEAVGIEVYSAQPTRIEYAPEVAAAMRRRRVAAIDAKHRDSVLTSVVDAVDDTVNRLTSRGLVELDDYERKALVKDLTVAFYTGRPE
ncbi:SPFH domain-containing protein [Streptomyces sp. NPDC006529]|uniref:SPFH domain-containing protein n=1 Tax=Streptomyces sp. NPDC006529 TaxID=3157177 RepID=UPI0033AC8044